MKRIRITLLFACLSLPGIHSFAQQKGPTISFDVDSYNFGAIEETAGKVTHEFAFTNTGGETLIISNVKASCGCTTPDWTKEPVAPGGKGFVAATYNPEGRPGKFNKSVTVTSNADPATTVLKISGDVSANAKPTIDDYPRSMGDIKLKTNHISFVKIKNTETKTETTDIINSGIESITVTFGTIPDHITLKVEPQTLHPNEKGVITATYNAPKKNDWGFMIDRVDILLNGTSDPKNRLSLSATIEEDFSGLSEQDLTKAPKIEFENTTYDFGTIKQGDVAEHDFTFKNTGKSDLLIRKTKASCGCTVVNPEKNIIHPGETSSLKAKFNSAGKKGKQSKTITVVSNDPHENNSSITLTITGTVNEPEK